MADAPLPPVPVTAPRHLDQHRSGGSGATPSNAAPYNVAPVNAVPANAVPANVPANVSANANNQLGGHAVQAAPADVQKREAAARNDKSRPSRLTCLMYQHDAATTIRLLRLLFVSKADYAKLMMREIVDVYSKSYEFLECMREEGGTVRPLLVPVVCLPLTICLAEPG